MKILVVDDNEQSLYMLQTLLQGHGYQVETAANGQEALEKAKADIPDVILSDILMPVMDGFTLCRELKRDNVLKKIPFIFYSATYTDLKDEQFAMSLGAESFIRKPVDPDTFLDMLKKAIHEAGKKPREITPVAAKEPDYFKVYNERLIRKLEEKLIQLEETKKVLEDEIAERKRMEKAVREEEEKYRDLADEFRAILEAVPDNLTLQSPDLKVLWANRGAAVGLNKEVSDLVGQYCYMLWHGRSTPCENCPVLKSFNTGKPQMEEVVTPDGRIWELRTVPIPNGEGIVRGVVELGRNITEHRQAEITLQESEARYRAIFESTGTATILVEEDTTIIMANQECLPVTGYTPSELIGTKWPKYVSPESRELMLKYHQLRREEPGKVPRKYEVKLINKKGDIRNAILDISMIPGTKQSVVSMLDITELRQAEQAIRESEEKYRSVVENAGEIILVAQDAVIQFINPKATEILGYSYDEFLFQPFEKFIHLDDREKVLDYHLRRTQGEALPEIYSFRVIDKKGNVNTTATHLF